VKRIFDWNRGPAKAGLLAKLCQRLTQSFDIRGGFCTLKPFNNKAVIAPSSMPSI